MKFSVSLQKRTVLQYMRSCGYAFEKQDPMTGEHAYAKPIGRYPKFHVYVKVSEDGTEAFLNLHFDQKRPSYKGSLAHNAEYDGPLVEQEAERMLRIAE